MPRTPKIVDPATMTASQINKALDKLDVERDRLTKEFIAAERGYETPSETALLSDPLALAFNTVANNQAALHREIELRYGPRAPSRLPTRGFGPRK